MTNTNETIADIIAEMRALSNPISDGVIAINGRSIADRLEAAHKCEKATAKKSSAVGDGAKRWKEYFLLAPMMESGNKITAETLGRICGSLGCEFTVCLDDRGGIGFGRFNSEGEKVNEQR